MVSGKLCHKVMLISEPTNKKTPEVVPVFIARFVGMKYKENF